MAEENPVDKWSKQLARVLKREVIFSSLDSGKKISEAKLAARRLERSQQLCELLEKVTHSELVVNKERARILQELLPGLRKKFPNLKNLSLVLIGSSVTGAADIRNISGNIGWSDIDWGVIADDDISGDIRIEIMNFVDQEIPKLAVKIGIPYLDSCSHYNAIKIHARSFKSNDQCWQYLFNLVKTSDKVYQENNPLLLAFEPSFPEATNYQSRQFVLEALRQLYHQDPVTWRKTVDRLMEIRQWHHRLMIKHLVSDEIGAPRHSIKLAREVANQSSDIMGRVFAELLYSTGQIED